MKMSSRTVQNSLNNICIVSFFSKIVCENNITKYQCSLCKNVYSGHCKSNLVGHIRRQHEREYNLKFTVNAKKEQELRAMRLKKIQSFVKIVTINMRPFSYLTDSGFLDANETDLKQLREAQMPIILNKNCIEIKDEIIKLSNQIHEKIMKETNGRLVSMMIDIATRHQRSILGITIRFEHDGDIVERAIAMVQLHTAHNAANISEEILKCISLYQMIPIQISSLTTDNASNMKAAIKSFDKAVTTFLENSCENASSDSEFDDEDMSDELNNVIQTDTLEGGSELVTELSSTEYEAMLSELQDEEAMDEILDDSYEYENLLNDIETELQNRTQLVFNVRCGAHTIQLAVRAAIKNSEINTVLDACQSVAKSLRQQKFICAANEKKIKMIFPRLRCKTRWDSEYRLVSINLNHQFTFPLNKLLICNHMLGSIY